jgi:hypothetical protein
MQGGGRAMLSSPSLGTGLKYARYIALHTKFAVHIHERY